MVIKFSEIHQRIKFWLQADRIGPDIPITQIALFFPSSMRSLCSKKLKHFGQGAEVRPGSYLEACSKISIGANVVIRPSTFLFADPQVGGGEIVIEDNVLIGSGVHFYTNNHNFSNPNIPIIKQGYPTPNSADGIRVEEGAWIGAGCIILPGVTIGKNAVVGGGAVVTRSVEAGVVVAGNPARALH